MTLVIDSSVVVAALIDDGEQGRWAETVLTSAPLAAPHLMVVEVANILRRSAASGQVTPDVAALAHDDLLRLPVDLFPYAPFADRAWQLRENLTSYDAWHVALAEALESHLATLDHRLVKADGPGCGFLTPTG